METPQEKAARLDSERAEKARQIKEELEIQETKIREDVLEREIRNANYEAAIQLGIINPDGTPKK